MVSLKNETIIPSKDLGLHHLDKPKHFIGAFIGIVVVTIGHLMIGNEMFTPKLINLKSALIHIKMDIRFSKYGVQVSQTTVWGCSASIASHAP